MDIGTIIREVEIVRVPEEPFDPSLPEPSLPVEPVPEPVREPVPEPVREPVTPAGEPVP